MLDITDTTRAYRTVMGNRVVVHSVVPTNAVGETVTFPVKATVIDGRRPHRKWEQIYTLEGRADVLKAHRDDIVDVW